MHDLNNANTLSFTALVAGIIDFVQSFDTVSLLAGLYDEQSKYALFSAKPLHSLLWSDVHHMVSLVE